MKQNILVWDLPTRLFHWLLAASVLGAFAIGSFVDDDSPGFSLHMLLGALAAFMLLLRVIWGLVGSRYARLSSLALRPTAVIDYFRGMLKKSDKRWLGHNPGSSVAIVAMVLLVLGVAGSGALMASNHALKELHELLAYTLMVTVVGHVAGVLLHTVRHRENLPLAMVDGRKQGSPQDGIASSHPLVALGFLSLTAAFGLALVQSYSGTDGTVRLPLLGTTLTLGEGAEPGEAADGEDADDD